ncbi:hypothetical protein BCR35DRAFT_338770 [Leucosporidium creatinivorum]|uniref:Glycosyltransferase family 25 protein n=1 Tax=Leucosporidium creatinivorum TaxID=106004 RepID=A0A1Y2FVW8_9BASI|nr:hypothetical protein BCR35DRAFT_338770 [Leucosporidium creatinivorum]
MEDDFDWSSDEGLNGLLAYRQHLELTTSPPGYSHSATLGFSHIYCISLVTAHDRRRRMEKLAKALGVELTFVDATPPTTPILRWIAERVMEVREKKVKVMVKSRKMAAGEIGGGGVGSPWLLGREELRADGLKEERLDGRDWVTYMEEEEDRNPSYFESEGAVRLNLDSFIAKSLYDLRAKKDEQLNAATLATWNSHIRTLQLMKRNGDQDALILEDDVDFEWDLARLWATAKRRLPEDWDSVYLGHCWSHELHKPAYLHPSLHQATQPRCLHAYAVSRLGASSLHAALSDPWLAYQAPIDVALAALVARESLNSFSLQPPLIIQSKDLFFDISPGITSKKGTSREAGGGNVYGGQLADSTWERILRDEGHRVLDPVFNPNDPAVNYRAGRPSNEPYKPPLNPLGAASHHSNPSPDSSFNTDDTDDTVLVDSAPGQPLIAVTHPLDAKDPSLPLAPIAKADADDSKPTELAPAGPKKIGTGGKFVVGQKKKLSPAGAGAKKGDAEMMEAKKEGGRRVGTGARPKGMGVGA